VKNKIEDYTEERCKEILKKVGIEEGQIVLDFGCGRNSKNLWGVELWI
jgi:cyclopropane fatty-acyl-phospholipid synthase-like methyltransferase